MKLTNSSRKLKPILILIVCMGIFVTGSCIYAADIDDAISNNNTLSVNALDDEEAEELMMADIDSDMDDPSDVISSTALPDSDATHHREDHKKQKRPIAQKIKVIDFKFIKVRSD